MGSRTWFTARSVISCDPMLKVDEVGIPMQIATSIQIPELATEQNIARLRVYVANGTSKYPGCVGIVKRDSGVYITVNHANALLEIGDTLNRNVVDGDVALFNRQPTLRGPQMTGHYIKVCKDGNTIRMNISACEHYNADFDGDEMGLFFATSTQARTELRMVSMVDRSMILRQTGAPIVGVFYDALASLAEVTARDISISRSVCMELFRGVSPVGGSIPTKMITGRELVQYMIPKINFSGKAQFYSPAYAPYLKYDSRDTIINIKEGKLLSGILDYKSAGQGVYGSIIHEIYNKHGAHEALETVYRIQQVLMEFIFNYGFTVSAKDMFISEKATSTIHDETAKITAESEQLSADVIAGKIIPPMGYTIEQYHERQQQEILQTGDVFINPIFSEINMRENGMYKLIAMCKKGNLNNFQSMLSAPGLQMVDGKRAEVIDGRTMPYFTRHNLTATANGFIPRALAENLDHVSFLHMARPARYGVINNALSTAVSGKQNRESGINLESLVVDNFRRCVKHNNVTQLLYGGFGIDTIKVAKVKLDSIMISNSEFETTYRNPVRTEATEREFETISMARKKYRLLFMLMEIIQATPMSARIQTFADVASIIRDFKIKYEDEKQEPANPDDVVSLVEKLCEEIPYIFMNGAHCERNLVEVPRKYEMAVDPFRLVIREKLASVKSASIGLKVLRLITERIKYVARCSLVDYGLPAGNLAAQSMTEPMTQYMLDSHKRSGVVVDIKDVQTEKMARNNELMMGTSSEGMANPKMEIRLLGNNLELAGVAPVATRIETILIRYFVNHVSVAYEEYGNPTHPKYAHESALIEMFEQHNPAETKPNDLTPWVVRLEIDLANLIVKNMSMEELVRALSIKMPDLYIVNNTEVESPIVVRCYLRGRNLKKEPDLDYLMRLKDIILALPIRGINGMSSAFVIPETRTFEDDDGSLINRKTYLIRTAGINYSSVMDRSKVDHMSTTTNSVMETLRIYGVGAARILMTEEIGKITTGLLPAHYSIYADEMTSTGVLTQFSKVGLIKREPTNVLLQIGYSHAKNALSDACLKGKTAPLYGTTAPMLTGRAPYTGTLYNQVVVNSDFVDQESDDIDDLLDDL